LGFGCDVDDGPDVFKQKIYKASTMHYHTIFIVGEKEEQTKTVSDRKTKCNIHLSKLPDYFSQFALCS